MELTSLIVVIVLGLIASAFFSGIETGLISLNRVRLRHEVEHKNRRALSLSTFVENTEKLLGTTLAGSNTCNVLIAVSSAALAMHLFGKSFTVDLTATLVSSIVVLVVAELVPKLLFRHYPHRLCLSSVHLLNAAAWLFAPLVSGLGLLMRAIARAGDQPEKPPSFFVTREELKHLAQEGEAGGAITTEERRMIDGVFDFPYKTVHEIMVPLSRIVTVAPETPVTELLDLSRRTGYARLPVRQGDKILGVVNCYEILFKDAAHEGRTARDLMQPPQVVVSTDRINRVLPVLRASRNPISLVVSPDSQPLGIVTIEDIVEEIVGDVEG
jgi:putative hemolysin